jgi:hypothetical protein
MAHFRVPVAFYFAKQILDELWTKKNKHFVNSEQTLHKRSAQCEKWTKNALFILNISDLHLYILLPNAVREIMILFSSE